MSNRPFDYIFLGAGAAGLSLLIRMIDSGKFARHSILMIDRDLKNLNDRTWCFWETGDGYFENLVQHRWEQLDFFSPGLSIPLDIRPYRYKLIRAIDFYNYALEKISRQPNIEFLQDTVIGWEEEPGGLSIRLERQEISAGQAVVFNSLYPRKEAPGKDLELLQHFKGWWLHSNKPCFDPSRATLMDFRVGQDKGTSFLYVLPLDPYRALVEYTQFTTAVLDAAEYDRELEAYVRDVLNLTDFTIEEEEFGIIPMTNRSFPFFNEGVYHIGAAGGQTKASTGYTFRFIQKQSDQILRQLVGGGPLKSLDLAPRRFHFYDSVLLRLLIENRLPGRAIFERLFERNPPSRLFRFLDNESRFTEEWQIIRSLQTGPFLRAALKLI